MTNAPITPEVTVAPGDVVHLCEQDYQHGCGQLRLRVIQVRLDLSLWYGGQWVWLEGIEINTSDRVGRFRQELVCGAALHRPPAAARPESSYARPFAVDPIPCPNAPGGSNVSLPDIATALRDLHVSVNQQQEMAKTAIQEAEKVRAEFRALTAGAANPLVKRALGNYARGIVKLRAGSWLLTQASGSLADYARVVGVRLPQQSVEGERKVEPSPDERSDNPERRRNQRSSLLGKQRSAGEPPC